MKERSVPRLVRQHDVNALILMRLFLAFVALLLVLTVGCSREPEAIEVEPPVEVTEETGQAESLPSLTPMAEPLVVALPTPTVSSTPAPTPTDTPSPTPAPLTAKPTNTP